MRRLSVLTILVLILLGVPLLLPASEGYDPMRVVSAQIARPNIYVVLDDSGSMAWNAFGQRGDVDDTGTVPSAIWTHTPAPWVAGTTTFYFTLTVTQRLPSRMATLKNALGNSVPIIPPYQPPLISAFPIAYHRDFTGAVVTPPASYTLTLTDYQPAKWSWTWKFVFARAPNRDIANPPFVAYDAAGKPIYGVVSASQAPIDVIGQTKEVVNWGLIIYAGSSCADPSDVVVTLDPNDTGDDTAVQTQMMLNSAGGLGCGGGTPTKGALVSARAAMQSVFNADPKYDCGRPYGVILVTDGLSNTCNPGGIGGAGGNWISPCGACPGPTCCDPTSGSSGINCPNQYTSFPAGASEALWNSSLTHGGTTFRVPIRTFVIGVSDQVSPCELNYTAYMGRTDASSPNGDAGYSLWVDPGNPDNFHPSDEYLPWATGDITRYSTVHGNYAWFATSANQIKDAFSVIVASMGPGDYATSQPIVSSQTGNTIPVTLLASTEYPGWKGHLYADDLADGTNLWEAGELLAARDPASRAIYTWNGSLALVPVDTANVANLNTLCGNCGITAAVVDYIRGVGRSWRLGALVNSTPTLVGPPVQWKSSDVPTHSPFEGVYGPRHPLVYVGSSDGMLHAFDAVDGYEVFAILTPDNLAEQVTFFNYYQSNPSRYPTGEPPIPNTHIYGVANSPRVQDVWFRSGGGGEYKTLLFLTQGPSSKMIAALDVTHPYPGRDDVVRPYDGSVRDYSPDPNYASAAPVSVVWTKSNADYAGLQYTWSIPAVTATTISTSDPEFEVNIGSGFNPASSVLAPQNLLVNPTLFSLDATDGSANDITTLTNLAAPSPFVGNQAFADSVMFKTVQRIFQEGIPQDVAIQADLNGRLFMLARPSGSSPATIFNASTHAGQSQPLYYSPAVAGFKSKMCFAFASGSYFEKSPNVNGSSATFRSRLYLLAKNQDMSVATAAQTRSWRLTDIPLEAGGTLSDQATVVASAMLLVPNSDNGLALALYPIYDPDSGDCAGTSYVIVVEFDPADLSTTDMTVNVIGSGAISGFTIAGNQVIISKSGVGARSRASTQAVPALEIGSGANGYKPLWWRELQ